ncbi:MAG TPA: type II secretion system protein GspD [bacterium]|nr:type II secretion system protein GspD [bacterium]HEX68033.1 type II secretion system protein GspD [bacterium]
MKMRKLLILILLFLSYFLRGEELVSINFRDVDISVVTKFVSQVTGKNFLLSDQVRGKVTIISPKKIPRDEVYRVFESILEIKGLVAIPAGNVIKIVPAREAKQYPLPVNIGKEPEKISPEDKMITQLIPLQYADAQQVVSLITPLVSSEGHITSYTPTNTIILSDYSSNLKRILTIIQRIDQPQAKMVTEILPLKYASASQLAQAISQVLESSQKGPTSYRRSSIRRATTSITSLLPSPRIIPDERTNSLIVVASLQDMERIKKLVEKLDVPAPRGKERIQVYYLQNADAEELAKVLSSTPLIKKKGEKGVPFKEEISILADKATNSLIISASPQDYEEIEKVIKKLDIPRPQVLVEALIADVSMEKLRELGVEWAGKRTEDSGEIIGGTKFKMNYAQPEESLALMNGILIGYLKENVLGGIIQAYEKDTGFRVLSTPHLLTLDNEEAKIVVGKNVPFVTSSRITEQDTVVRSYEYRDVGIILTITPHINKEGEVRLKIHQEVTNLSPEYILAEAPVTNKREAETTVTVPDKSTVVIGGLIRNDKTEVVHKVPLLGDIPLLGYLFRRKETTFEKRNLLIFITPHIIRTPEVAQELRRKKEKEMKESLKENAST